MTKRKKLANYIPNQKIDLEVSVGKDYMKVSKDAFKHGDVKLPREVKVGGRKYKVKY